MPKRNRNKPAWAIDPRTNRAFVSKDGYPIKIGDTIIGGISGDPYTVIEDQGRIKVRRLRDSYIGTSGVIRDGHLSVKHKPGRMKEHRAYREGVLDRIKAAKKVSYKENPYHTENTNPKGTHHV